MTEPDHRWRVYRITIDTNVFLRSLIRRKNDANYLLSLWHELRFVLVLSHAILDEIRGGAVKASNSSKNIHIRCTLHSISHLINLLGQRAAIVEVPFSYELCRDVKDDPVADCAVWGRVQFLVSYDNDFLDDSTLRQALFEFGVEIAHPRTFLEKIHG